VSQTGAGDTVDLTQRLTRWGALGIALGRWPYRWAERQWGYAPSWWLRLLSAPLVAWRVLRSPQTFPIEQRLHFDAAGLEVRGAHGQRRVHWNAFSGWIDLGRSWMLLAPGIEQPVLHRQLPRADADRLRAMLLTHVTMVEAPKH
jgi:hypothetical protein